MSRSKIEWLRNPATGKAGFTLNPVKGLCPMDCRNLQNEPYCYARRMYKRFHWNEKIQYSSDCFHELEGGFGDKYFVGSTMELFGDWVKPAWMEDILSYTRQYPHRTFIFLTKKPENLIKWSPFPKNCWVGTSIIADIGTPLYYIKQVQATVKFISFEPLLGEIPSQGLSDSFSIAGINWVIVGQQTPPKKNTIPQPQWIDNITIQCDKANVPVFLKDNLRPLLFPEEKEIGKLWGDKNLKFSLRQEWAKV